MIQCAGALVVRKMVNTASWPRLRVKRVMRAHKVTQKAVALFSGYAFVLIELG